MEYLKGKNFVHPDLAACIMLVSEDNVPKVSDFGVIKEACSTGTRANCRSSEQPTRPREKRNSPPSLMCGISESISAKSTFGRMPCPRTPLKNIIFGVEQG